MVAAELFWVSKLTMVFQWPQPMEARTRKKQKPNCIKLHIPILKWWEWIGTSEKKHDHHHFESNMFCKNPPPPPHLYIQEYIMHTIYICITCLYLYIDITCLCIRIYKLINYRSCSQSYNLQAHGEVPTCSNGPRMRVGTGSSDLVLASKGQNISLSFSPGIKAD